MAHCPVLLAASIAIAWAFGAVSYDAPFGAGNRIAAALLAMVFAMALLFLGHSGESSSSLHRFLSADGTRLPNAGYNPSRFGSRSCVRYETLLRRLGYQSMPPAHLRLPVAVERQAIVTAGLPFAELKARSLIDTPARDANNSPDFSRLIRKGLPFTPGFEVPREQRHQQDHRTIVARVLALSARCHLSAIIT